MAKKKKKAIAGGKAEAAGGDYENRVATWFAVRILLGSAAAPLFDLPATIRSISLDCQTDAPVDDANIGTSDDGLIFVQAKRTAHLSSKKGSPLVKSFNQFVRQHKECQERTGSPAWSRPLDPTKDRLVLATRKLGSSKIVAILPRLLRGLRDKTTAKKLVDVATSQAEREVAKTIDKVLRIQWKTVYGRNPSADEHASLLRFIWVQPLDVEDADTDAIAAQDQLRATVLAKPAQSKAAFAEILKLAGRLRADRSGVTSVSLKSTLIAAGIDLKASPDYRADIAALKKWTKDRLARSGRYTHLIESSPATAVVRDVKSDLRTAANSSSFVLVGEPGAGKSGLLYELAAERLAKGEDVVFLPVELLNVTRLGELQTELGLTHPLSEVIENWFGTGNGLVIFDALDAARKLETQPIIREIVEAILTSPNKRWTTVASIRKYDLRQGSEWTRLFSGKPPIAKHFEKEFGGIRHVAISRLTDGEIHQTSSSIPELAELLRTADTPLKELLRNIFNLHLLAELLASGAVRSDLAGIQSQPELLATYWDRRIRKADGQHDAREQALLAVINEMIKSKSLRVNRQTLVAQGHSAALVELEKDDILRTEDLPSGKSNGDVLLFTHHILFDYAVARLLFRRGRDANAVISVLASERALTVMLAPSLTIALSEVWADGGTRNDFWTLAFRLATEPNLPAVASLTAPSVAADFATDVSEFDPLIAALKSPTPERAQNFLQGLLGALFVRRSRGYTLFGSLAGPWMSLAARLSEIGNDFTFFALRMLLATETDNISKMTPGQKSAAGLVSRRMLEFAWERSKRSTMLIITALSAVAETHDTDPAESAKLIRRSLEKEHLAKFGHEELHWLARHMRAIYTSDSALAIDIYEAAYAYSETSTEKTNLGSSAILAMSSNRRQDYEMAWHGLSETLPDFLRTDYIAATKAISRAVHEYARRERMSEWPRRALARKFDHQGMQFNFIEDNSYSWYRGGLEPLDDAPSLLKVFDTYLDSLGAEPDGKARFKALINTIGLERGSAVLWASLFITAAKYPSKFAKLIAPVATVSAILSSFDTRYQVGQFLSASYSHLSKADRAAIEVAILGLKGKLGKNAKPILAGCIPRTFVETQPMKAYLKALDKKVDKPTNLPPVSFNTSITPFDSDAYLSSIGVALKEPANAVLRAAAQAVDDLPKTAVGTELTAEEARRRLPVLDALHAALLKAKKNGADPKAIQHSEGVLGAGAAVIARAKIDIIQNKDIRNSAMKYLTYAAKSKNPVYSAKVEEQFKKSVSWGSPSARAEAASGLIGLARIDKKPDRIRSPLIHRLSRDRVGHVRYQIVRALQWLYASEPSWVWKEIEYIAKHDPANTMVRCACDPLGRVAFKDVGRALKIAKGILKRFDKRDSDDIDKTSNVAASFITDLSIFFGNAEAIAFADDLVAKIGKWPKLISQLVARYSDQLLVGPVANPEDKTHKARRAVIKFYKEVLESANVEMIRVCAGRALNTFSAWSAEDQASYQGMIKVLDELALRLYFAFGAGGGQSKPPLTDEQKRLFGETLPILEKLTTAGFAHISHHLIQLFQTYVPVDPSTAFRLIAQTVRSSEQFGYSFESMAADLVVEIVETYLADHRDVFADSNRLNDLMDCLDIFVRAGWPKAQSLTFRLGEIWR
ncbi:MAG TPA: hypothetical protein VFI23_14275 [Rhizomicrobium sp.]|nr:hypothetical protein [Rhizomicrobium sp.]